MAEVTVIYCFLIAEGTGLISQERESAHVAVSTFFTIQRMFFGVKKAKFCQFRIFIRRGKKSTNDMIK